MKREYLIKPILDKDYPTADYGVGIYIFDKEGKKYIDGASGAVTASIGHGVTEITNAMIEQAKKISFVYRLQFTSEPAEHLAKKLGELTPGDLNWTFFVNSGSEATETAMKIAIQHWQEKGYKGKNKILSRWMSYHGITIGALSMSGHIERRKRFVPLLEDYPSISPPYCYRCPFNSTHPECNLMCAKELDSVIRRTGAENIAAFIAEPIIGSSAGAVVPPKGYYEEIKEICERHEILFIADEIMTGIGRTGKMFAMEHWGVEPDIMALGKGMSAGYTPIAATMVSDRVMEPILLGSKSIMSGHTYSANPQSAAVALAVLEYIEKHKLIEASRENGKYLISRLQELAQRYQIIGDVRGKGLFAGVEFVSNIFNKMPFSPEIKLTSLVVKRAMEKGLIVYPSTTGIEGIAGDGILVSPPLIIKKEEIDILVLILEETINEIQQELQTGGLIHTVV